jgi:hypothetical protein
MGNSTSGPLGRKSKQGSKAKLGRLLEDTTLQDICTTQNIVTIKDNATVEEALKASGGSIARGFFGQCGWRGHAPGCCWCFC